MLRPRKQLRDAVSQTRHFDDHAGQKYTTLQSFAGENGHLAKLGVQLYCLGNNKNTPPVVFGQCLLNRLSDALGDRARTTRVDIYTGFKTVEDCIEHHRREKAFRKKANLDMRNQTVAELTEDEAHEKLVSEIGGKQPLPHIVPSWCRTGKFWREMYREPRYRSWIMVVPQDRQSWDDVVDKGILQVLFDQDLTPEMETTMEDLETDDEETELKGDHGFVLVEKSGLDFGPVHHRLICVRKQPTGPPFTLTPEDPNYLDRLHEYFDGWKTPGRDGIVQEFWQTACSVFPDCCYRDFLCEGCWNDVPHDECPTELDEHFLDEDGQCVACRRFLEYRRRSKRIVTKRKRCP